MNELWDIDVPDNPCTCDHEPDQHGKSKCNVAGCKCEAGWEQ